MTLKNLLKLVQWRVTTAIFVVYLISYAAAGGRLDFSFLCLAMGFFLVGNSASAFNQWQERGTDALMPRTKHRPLSAAAISPLAGILVVGMFFLLGTVIFWVGMMVGKTGYMPFWLVLGSLIMYNAFYTPLKSRSLFSIVPGFINGASPVLIGWTAAGGRLVSPEVWALFIFVSVWQIPHFNMLLFTYRHQYKKANLVVLSNWLNEKQLVNVTYIWILAMGASALLIPMLGTTKGVVTSTLITLMVVALSLFFIKLYDMQWKGRRNKRAFGILNAFSGLIMLTVLADALLAQ